MSGKYEEQLLEIKNYIEYFSVILCDNDTKELLEEGKKLFVNVSPKLSKAINIFKTVKDLPSKLLWSKLESFLSGASDIPREKRQNYITKLGERQSKKDIERMFNIINNISEKEKMVYLVNLYKHLLSEDIDRKQFFIMSNSIKDSIYEDLQYLKEHINDTDPFKLDENTCRFVSLNIINQVNDTTHEAIANYSKTKYIYNDFAKSLCKYAFE